jgi:starch synthase
MRVLFAASEVAPIVKTGGLGDVTAALPAALRALNVDARILIPGYAQALQALDTVPVTGSLEVLPGLPPVEILESRMPQSDVPIYLVHCPELYAREGGPYQHPDGTDWRDNDLRFGVLSRVAAWLGTRASPLQWQPDIVHSNDWQTGLTPAYVHFAPDRTAGTVQSIHNMAFLGRYDPGVMAQLGLPREAYHADGFEFHGDVSFLKAGLRFADRLTTVSPSYAQEIQGSEFGFGLDGLLRHRRDVLSGILNGIDTTAWDPATDKLIARAYSDERLRDKHYNKHALRKRLGLAQAAKMPLLGMVCRLSPQKGVDLAIAAINRLLERPFQLAVLGSGSAELACALHALADSAPDRFAFVGEFDDSLAHLIEAGSDMFLMPSRFEPCGLNQMYSMRYGTIPIVRRTGGLADTVTDATAQNLRDGLATGFVFDNADAADLTTALARALDTYPQRARWKTLQLTGMRSDWSWARSALAYRALYREIVKGP